MGFSYAPVNVNKLLNRQPTVGSIYNKSSWANLTGLTPNGTTPTVNGSNQLAFSGGANTFTQTLDINYVTCLEKWAMSVSIIADTPTLTSYGLGIGIRSNSSYAQYGVTGYVDLSTNATRGIVRVYAGSTSVAVSTTALSFSAGDTIQITISRNYNYISVVASNLTTKAAASVANYYFVLTYSAPFIMPNSGKFAVYNFGGNQIVTSLSVRSNAIKNPDILFVGDSKTVGYYSGAKAGRFADIVGAHYQTQVNAGGNDGTVEVLARIPEIISILPKIVVLNIGRNDIGAISAPTIYANYASIVSQLQAAGITVYHLLPIYETTANQAALTANIIATFGAANCIADQVVNYSGTASTVLVADNIHPNAFAHSVIANSILNSGFFNTIRPSSPIAERLLTVINSNNGNIPWVNSNGVLQQDPLAFYYDVDHHTCSVGTPLPSSLYNVGQGFFAQSTATVDVYNIVQRSTNARQGYFAWSTAGGTSAGNPFWSMGYIAGDAGNTLNLQLFNGTTVVNVFKVLASGVIQFINPTIGDASATSIAITGTRIGNATLVAGTIAISITGVTTSSRAFVTRTVAANTALTTGITAVCTAGTLTITADVAAGTINTADTSSFNYFVIN